MRSNGRISDEVLKYLDEERKRKIDSIRQREIVILGEIREIKIKKKETHDREKNLRGKLAQAGEKLEEANGTENKDLLSFACEKIDNEYRTYVDSANVTFFKPNSEKRSLKSKLWQLDKAIGNIVDRAKSKGELEEFSKNIDDLMEEASNSRCTP